MTKPRSDPQSAAMTAAVKLDRRGGQLPANYSPEKGLKKLAVAEAAEQYFARAKDATRLYEAVEAKLGEQRRFVLWYDETFHGGHPSGGRRKKDFSPEIFLPEGAPDGATLTRWRKRLKDPRKFDETLKAAQGRCVKVCEARQGYSDHARATFTGDEEWNTPAEFLEATRYVLGEVDLDPASNDRAQEVVRADRYFTKKDNGLEQAWHGRVWLNPPYAQPLITDFVSKLVAERKTGQVTAAIMLTNNSADTGWFHQAAEAASAICFTRGRIKFYKSVGVHSAPTQGQAFFYFGDNVEAFARRFQEIGFVVVPA